MGATDMEEREVGKFDWESQIGGGPADLESAGFDCFTLIIHL